MEVFPPTAVHAPITLMNGD